MGVTGRTCVISASLSARGARGRSALPDNPPYGLARNISIHTSRTRTGHEPKLSLRSVLGLLDCELD